MGSGSSVKERQIEQMLNSKNPSVNELALILPSNKEIRVKKIYHVNRQEIEPVRPVQLSPVKLVQVVAPTLPKPPPAPAAVAYRPRVVVNDPNASAIRIKLNQPVRN